VKQTGSDFFARKKRLFTTIVVTLCCVTAIVLYVRMARPFLDFWVDDAGISFTFVRHIAEGYGSVAYPGGERVEGFSNPTWVALLVVAYKFGGDPFVWSQRLGLAFGIAMLVLLGLYAFLADDDRRPWPIALAALLAATNASFVIWNQSGMENSLYGFFMLAAIVLVVREGRDENAFPWSVLPLFLLAITRPEGVAHTAIAGFFLLLTDLLRRCRPSKRLLVWAGAFLLLFGTYHLWHYFYFARPFPNTYYAKVQPDRLGNLFEFKDRGWMYVLAYLDAYHLKTLLLLSLPAFASRRFWREALYIFLIGLFLLFFPIYSRGDWMEGWRFLSVFPLVLALLLGLGAYNLAVGVNWAAQRKWPAKFAAPLALLAAVVYILVPLSMIIGPSQKYAAKYEKEPETSVKRIATRVKWWSKTARRIALRPEDTTMTDMDMGGTTYHWPGMILDIGYLVDVPLATHRYTPHFRDVVDEYFFEERRPEFIHVRRGWGKATTIPGNRKFKQRYLKLPDDRKFGRIPNGNYVRRDLIELPQGPALPLALEPFANGLRLLAVEAPKALRPKRATPIFLTWVNESSYLSDCTFSIGLAREGGEPRMISYPPVMGWLPLGEWERGRIYREVVWVDAPDDIGSYRWFVGVKTFGQDEERRELPLTAAVSKEAAKQEANRLLDEAENLAARNAAGADLAVPLLRRAEWIYGAERIAKRVEQVDRQRLNMYVEAARKAAEADEYLAAALSLRRCWRLDARDKQLNELGWRVADKLYEIGRAQQAAEEYREAYEAFSAACQAQPQHAWARKRAEQVRLLRDL